MKTLCIDTTHKYLVIGLFEDDILKTKIQEFSWKKQSEHFFPALMQCMNECGWEADELDQVVITKGPGSYTGERIAMAFAKVFCANKNKPLYTISTYQMIAGLENCQVIMDARSKRAYCGICENGQLIHEEIKTIDQLLEEKQQGIYFVGDIDLVGEEYIERDYVKNFMDVKESWEYVENIHTLTPHYLKSSEDLVK